MYSNDCRKKPIGIKSVSYQKKVKVSEIKEYSKLRM